MKKRPKSSYELAKQIVADYLESLDDTLKDGDVIHFHKTDHMLVSAIEKVIVKSRTEGRRKERLIWHDAINAGRLLYPPRA